MKKISLLIITLLAVFGMVSCNGYQTVDYSTLPYQEYLDDDNPIVIISVRGYGDIVLQLFPNVAENTVNNFIQYIEDGDYSNSTFHRVIEDFMIQGGIVEETNCPIDGEFSTNGVGNGLRHYRGVISMARTSLPNSATSQFFIVHQTSSHLDGNYAAFGGMIAGFDVLDAIATVSTNIYDMPENDIVISKVTVQLNGYVPADVVC